MLSKDYILGFVEGEGCFSILVQRYIDRKPRKNVGKQNKIKNPLLFRIVPTFRVTNVEANLPLMEEIKASFGCGSIYVQRRDLKSDRMSSVCYYYTKSFSDALAVKNYFEGLSFRTTKGKDFILWSKCIELIMQGKNKTKEGILEICSLRDQMNFRKTKNKWTIEEVKKILEEKPTHILVHLGSPQQSLLHNNNSSFSPSWIESKQGNFKPNRFVDSKNKK